MMNKELARQNLEAWIHSRFGDDANFDGDVLCIPYTEVKPIELLVRYFNALADTSITISMDHGPSGIELKFEEGDSE